MYSVHMFVYIKPYMCMYICMSSLHIHMYVLLLVHVPSRLVGKTSSMQEVPLCIASGQIWSARLSCSALQCIATCCSVMQCYAVCFSVLQCVAVWCNVLQCGTVCVAIWCSMMQCVAVCVAVCCRQSLLFISHWDISTAPLNAHQPRVKAPSPSPSLRLHQCICVYRGGGVCAVVLISGRSGEEGEGCARE